MSSAKASTRSASMSWRRVEFIPVSLSWCRHFPRHARPFTAKRDGKRRGRDKRRQRGTNEIARIRRSGREHGSTTLSRAPAPLRDRLLAAVLRDEHHRQQHYPEHGAGARRLAARWLETVDLGNDQRAALAR